MFHTNDTFYFIFLLPQFSYYYFGLRVCCPNISPCINDNFYDPIIVPKYDNWFQIYSSIETYFTTSTLISIMNAGEQNCKYAKENARKMHN